MLPGIKTDNKIHKCPFIWLSTRIFTVTDRRNIRTDRPNSPRGRNLVPRFLRHFYNVTVTLGPFSRVRKAQHKSAYNIAKILL